MGFLKNIKKIHSIKSEVRTLARAYMDDRTELVTKLIIAILSLAYIVSPVDILPDFLPLLGITDDVLIIPLLMWILIPNNILEDARKYVANIEKKEPHSHHWIFWTCMSILGIMLVYTIVELLY